jgi:hypothetical protein
MTERNRNAAVRKVVDGIGDPRFGARYPDRAHFIDASDPAHGDLATRALYSGDPVVLVWPNGVEVVFTPEHARGIAAVMVFAMALLARFARGRGANVVRLPRGTRVEARDASGAPIAA